MAPPILVRMLAQAWGMAFSVGTRAAVDAWRVHAARNASAGVVGQRLTRTMTSKHALEILDVPASNPEKLTAPELEQAKAKYTQLFEANAPEGDGPGGSPYLQGKVMSAYQHLEAKAGRA